MQRAIDDARDVTNARDIRVALRVVRELRVSADTARFAFRVFRRRHQMRVTCCVTNAGWRIEARDISHMTRVEFVRQRAMARPLQSNHDIVVRAIRFAILRKRTHGRGNVGANAGPNNDWGVSRVRG